MKDTKETIAEMQVALEMLSKELGVTQVQLITARLNAKAALREKEDREREQADALKFSDKDLRIIGEALALLDERKTGYTKSDVIEVRDKIDAYWRGELTN